jgi:hypothetical protein
MVGGELDAVGLLLVKPFSSIFCFNEPRRNIIKSRIYDTDSGKETRRKDQVSREARR